MTFEIALLLIGGLVFLIFGGDLFVRGAAKIAALLGVSPMIIGLTVVAFGTSAPELAVSLGSALKGNADIAISNVVGSNLFNILFILGVSALISPLVIQSKIITREIPLMFGSALLLYFFSLNLNINKIESFILFVGIVAYTGWLVFEATKHRKENLELERESEVEYSLKGASKKDYFISFAFIAVGLALIMLGADWLVDGAVRFAKTMGVSDAVIGATIVAAGTSLPEVVASVMATIKGERDIAVGNVVGSNIYNTLAIVGISGLTVSGGINVSPSLLSYDYLVMIGATLACWPIFRTGHRISRFEGALFFAGYVAFTVFLIRGV